VQKKLSNLQDKRLNEIVKDWITHIPEVESIILFGSRARNAALPESDYDIIIIAPFKGTIFDRLKKIFEYIPPDLRIEAIGYTSQEFEVMLHSFHLLPLEVLHDGIPLYDTGFFKRMLEEFRIFQSKGLERKEFYWVHPFQVPLKRP